MEEHDILEIVKEDILRLLAEEASNKSPLKFVGSEIKASSSLMSEAIKELEAENLIQVGQDSVALTKHGQNRASSILEKHLTIERYLEKARSKGEAHEAAHVLEHYISQEVIDNIKELSTLGKKGIPLTEFKFNTEGIITDINPPDFRLFERLISMGVVPGERIRITNRIGHTTIATVNRVFAIGEDVAQGIEVLEYERT
jgi:Mn-dependent DtxR family transcriptional regulator